MNRRTTIILVVLFALLAGYAYYTQQNNPNPLPPSSFTPAPTDSPVFSFNPDEVQTIEVRNLQTLRVTRVNHVAGNWMMEVPSASPADTTVVGRVLSDLTRLSASRVITNAADLGVFGLITPTLQARFTMSNTTTYAINVGNALADKSSFYAAYPGDSRVFLISAGTVQDLTDFAANPPYPPTAAPTPPLTPVPPETPFVGPAAPTATGTPKP